MPHPEHTLPHPNEASTLPISGIHRRRAEKPYPGSQVVGETTKQRGLSKLLMGKLALTPAAHQPRSSQSFESTAVLLRQISTKNENAFY